MIVYPYSSPIVMTDDIFQLYGGSLEKGVHGQHTVAYVIGEKQMTSHIGTFLSPTVVTGTFPWPAGHHLVLPYSHITSIPNVTVLTPQSYATCELDENDGCAFVWDDTYGYIDVRQVAACCACCASGSPYQVRVVMNAGLPSGYAASQPDMLLALTLAAEINLNRIVDPSANEGTGDIGIEEFSNMGYREKRIGMKRSAFGNSAKANEIALMTNTYRKKRALKF